MDYNKIKEESLKYIDTPGYCSSCIYLYDEGMLTCCIKNKRWKDVEYNQECDIDSWEGI